MKAAFVLLAAMALLVKARSTCAVCPFGSTILLLASWRMEMASPLSVAMNVLPLGLTSPGMVLRGEKVECKWEGKGDSESELQVAMSG